MSNSRGRAVGAVRVRMLEATRLLCDCRQKRGLQGMAYRNDFRFKLEAGRTGEE